ncbi:Glycoside hydrolase family 16 protein [Mycena sanguinolenta]|uniref:Glycoside hydrolase family 16 protein n=1 Tax=Mycena sanguinolenta TaxID=230812 RepID=A0A8H7DEI5_9AGAR|nr:Glycoside hydrolase family 16 protein [Mycena sanguinolenta]
MQGYLVVSLTTIRKMVTPALRRPYSTGPFTQSLPPIDSSVMKGAFWISVASTASSALAATYSRSENIVGTGFYNSFNFEAIQDPTAGRVNYVDEATAKSQNLTFASDNTFILRADFKTVISDSSATGRNSVRIRTNNAYTTHVAVRYGSHAAGMWDMASSVITPAVESGSYMELIITHRWETNEANWPAGGEVDIVEGVNDQGTDQITLHTSPGCTMPASRTQTGTSLLLDCDTNANGNAGCGVTVGQASSFGPTFNTDGGGWYAIERTTSFINVWFWSRNDASVPADVKAGGTSINTNAWGTPAANFPNTDCNLSQFFDANNIIINLTFCGDWAGAVYAQSGCPSTCNSYVDQNPSAFVDAYFQFNSINVYE